MACLMAMLTQCDKILIVIIPWHEFLSFRVDVVLFVMNHQIFSETTDNTPIIVTRQYSLTFFSPSFVPQ